MDPIQSHVKFDLSGKRFLNDRLFTTRIGLKRVATHIFWILDYGAPQFVKWQWQFHLMMVRIQNRR